MEVRNIEWPASQLATLGDAIAPYAAGKLDLTALAQRCGSDARGLVEVTSWWWGIAPRGAVWLRNRRVADIVLSGSSLDGWVASVVDVAEVRPGSQPRAARDVLADLTVQWAPDGGLRFGELIIDPRRPELRLRGFQVKITPPQKAVLEVLAREPGRRLNAEEIGERIGRTREQVYVLVAAVHRHLEHRRFHGRLQTNSPRGYWFCPPDWPVWADLRDPEWDLEIDRLQERVRMRGREPLLTPSQIELLCVLVAEPHGRFTPGEFLQRLTGVNTVEGLRRCAERLNAALGVPYVTWGQNGKIYRTSRGS